MIARLFAVAALLVGLAGCGAVTIMDPIEDVQRRAAWNDGPTELTLYTVINKRSGGGAHAGLMIAADQTVLWDPAGSFRHPFVPERGDLLYGVTDNIVLVYEDYHARETFDVVRQTVPVPPDVARRALALAAEQGAAGSATCAWTTSGILRQLPGFEDLPRTFYPKTLMNAFAGIPGVETRRITDDDADKNHGVLFEAAQDALGGT